MAESQQVKIAVLQMQMKNIEKKVDDGFVQVNAKIDELAHTLTNFSDAATARYATVNDVEEVRKLATSQLRYAVVGTVLVTSIITSLVIFFFTHQ